MAGNVRSILATFLCVAFGAGCESRAPETHQSGDPPSLSSLGDSSGLKSNATACAVPNEGDAASGLEAAKIFYEHGVALEQGLCGTPDEAAAVAWYQKAAKKDFPPAQHSLGLAYRDGRSVNKDLTMAFSLFTLAANAQYAKSYAQLGQMYLAGSGIPQDSKLAFEWFGKGALAKEPESQFMSGKLLSTGQGTTRDPNLAWTLIKAAADQGYQPAIDYVRPVEEELAKAKSK